LHYFALAPELSADALQKYRKGLRDIQTSADGQNGVHCRKIMFVIRHRKNNDHCHYRVEMNTNSDWFTPSLNLLQAPFAKPNASHDKRLYYR
jgi:hypothetical protein